MSLTRPLTLIILLALLAIYLLRPAPAPQELRQSRLLLGTVVEITVLGPDQAALETAVNAAFAEIARIEALMTPHQPQSDVSRLSAAAEETTVAAETAEVIALGLQLAQASDGALDLTLGRVKALWAIESETPRVPSSEELATALAGTGPAALQLDGLTVRKSAPQLAVDLGAVAKGYAVDRAVAVLRTAGVTRASVNAGGDLFLLGDQVGRPWRIGIQHPRTEGQVAATLLVADQAVVTSGDYERFFEQDGVRYHHIFDPQTGLPGRRCQSASVVAPTAALADALSTAVFILGPEAGLALVAQFPGALALVIDAAGGRHVSPGLQERIEWP
ncbi:MAG: FAD:protein FMN transferase [Trichloromonadaceae bacterium]